MSKRIVILVKGKFVFEDNTKNLDYLDNDIKLISETLSYYGKWELSEVIELKNPQDIMDILVQYAGYDEVLFYYTGHGATDANDKFVLVGKNDKRICLRDVLDNSKNEINNCRLTLVIDACRSGYFLKEGNKPQLECEIFTATDLGKAYKSVDEDISYFTKLFCMYIQESKKEKSLYLDEISTYIENESKKSFEQKIQKKQSPEYIFTGRNNKDKSIIAHQVDTKTEQPPSEQKLSLTIQLHPSEKDSFKITIWAKSDDGTYLKNIAVEDRPLHKTKIAQYIDDCIDDRYKNIPSENIYLIFVMPSNLMTENINAWKLDRNRELGTEYTILMRGLERFTSEGENFDNKLYRLTDWEKNWEHCDKKGTKGLCDIHHFVTSNERVLKIPSKQIARTPFIILKYSVDRHTFITLYQSHISIALWINDCIDYEAFEKLFHKYSKYNLKELLNNIDKLQPYSSNLKGNIMLLYDNPADVPPDEIRKREAKTPKGEKNGN